MRWQRGQTAVADLVDVGELVTIADGRAHADELLSRARQGLALLNSGEMPGDVSAGTKGSAEAERPNGDTGRVVALCADALLAAQDLAVSTSGGQRTVSAVMTHQFQGVLGTGPFDSLHDVPSSSAPTFGVATAATTADTTADALQAASWTVEFTAQLLGSGRLHPFDAV